jgi:Uri superfamily endonuclease
LVEGEKLNGMKQEAAYLLFLKAGRPVKVRVGSLGLLSLPAGYYVYAGSAVGPGGVKARVGRHLRLARLKAGKVRWHIDYLLTDPNVAAFESWNFESWKIENHGRIECVVSKEIEKVSDLTVTGFGSSDCRLGCRGHLHYFRRDPRRTVKRLLAKLGFRLSEV